MAHLDRRRAERVLTAAGLDGLILFSPESFTYATDASPGVATMWREAGAVAVLVPADPGLPEMAVVSDLFAASFRASSHIADIRESPIWVEAADLNGLDLDQEPAALMAAAWDAAGRPHGFARPATFDPSVCARHLSDALTERGLSRGRIGFEGSAVSVRDHARLTALLEVDLVDASETVGVLKMVKSPGEIVHLRDAVGLAETGIGAIRDAITGGVTSQALSAVWRDTIDANRGDIALTGAWDYISVGPNPWGGDGEARPGDLIKVDVGCVVEGYTSDSGRTFVLGEASALQRRLYDALMQGFEAGAALFRPGVALSEIHRATTDAIRATGFPRFSRGHVGHSLGASLGIETWPFISADSDLVLEPGMVMAFECPWYVDGLGGMIIENQLLVTDTGHEMMNALPLDLVAIAA